VPERPRNGDLVPYAQSADVDWRTAVKRNTTIVVADNGPVRTVTLNRPERRNAITPEMQVELMAALEEAEASDCRVLVFAGAGDAFCSGLDLSTLQGIHDKTPAEHRTDAERLARLFLALYELPIPTIAAVHGAAIAGGTGLAMICDFTIATPDAKFGFTETRIGFVPALVSAFLALQVGHKQSMNLLLTGRLFGAEEAHRLGLVNEIVQPAELVERVHALAGTLIANSPQALAATKRLVTAQHREWLSAAIIDGIEASIEARTTPDFREGIAAFLEKRKPIWPRSLGAR
jgi:methylglutaconyl-CoA hydratase